MRDESPSGQTTGTPRRSGGTSAGRVAEDDQRLDDRKAAILTAVVSEYVDTAQPVGSAHVTGLPGVEVSSATVRSEMAALERDGYLVQPHTSAGRIPTDMGYRYFVDHLGASGAIGSTQRVQVRQFFAHVHGEVEDLLHRTSRLLTGLTDCAAVVVGPTHESASIRSVQLVGLGPRVVLLVAVLADGAVEKRTLDLASDADDEMLATTTSHLTINTRGKTLVSLGPISTTGDRQLDSLVKIAVDALISMAADKPENVFVGGSSRMAQAFDAVDTVRSVLSILEQQLVVVELIEDILDRGLSVAIGTEHGFEPLSACALVVAPVPIDGETVGTVGVLGPTRMNYPKALAVVQLVGEQLGARLGRLNRGEQGVRS